MNDLDENLIRNQMGVYVDIAMIVYSMFLKKLESYSEIGVTEKHQIAKELTHAITIKSCLNENAEDIIYHVERIADNLEIQRSQIKNQLPET